MNVIEQPSPEATVCRASPTAPGPARRRPDRTVRLAPDHGTGCGHTTAQPRLRRGRAVPVRLGRSAQRRPVQRFGADSTLVLPRGRVHQIFNVGPDAAGDRRHLRRHASGHATA